MLKTRTARRYAIAAPVVVLLVAASLFLGGCSAEKRDSEIVIEWVHFPLWRGMHGTDRAEFVTRYEKLHKRKPNPMEGPQYTFLDWPRAQAREFCRQNPGVKVRIELCDWANGKQKLEIRASAGVMPDLFYWGDIAMGVKFARYGLLEPIEDYVTGDDLADPVYADAIALARTDGHVWMWPWMVAANFWVANKTIFEERGCADLLPSNPDRTWTCDEFLAAARATTFDREGDGGTEHVYGCAFEFITSADYHLNTFLWGRGARYFDPTGRRVVINSPEGIAGLTFLRDLVHEHKVMPPMGATASFDLFLDGRAALISGSYGTPNWMRQATEEGRYPKGKVKLYPVMPAHAPPHPARSYTSPTGFYVCRQSDPRKRDMVMKFCRFLTSGQNARAVKAIGVFPVRQEAMAVYDEDEHHEYYRYMARVAKFAAEDPKNPYAYYLRQFSLPMYQAVVSGEKSPKEAADECARRGTEFLAEERRRLRLEE